MDYFNPRPCVRGDWYINHRYTFYYKNFNPRPCVRGDRQADKPKTANRRFQSTPLREGRPHNDATILYVPKGDFNPRPCVRGDMTKFMCLRCLVIFQSTPLREGRRMHILYLSTKWKFQSTPLREGRRCRKQTSCML